MDHQADRHAGLVGFGVLQIAAGAACAALLLGTVAGAEAAARQGTTLPVASTIFLFGIAASYFVTVGVGSIRARRWARALSVSVSALWLAGGALGAIATAIVRAPVDIRGIVILGASIVISIALIAFYSRDDVRATVELRDPKRRWTDRVPAPVLALVVVMGVAAAWLLVNLSSPVVPIFGSILTGASASLTLLALAALCAILAVQLYRLKESAWWTVVLLQLIGCAIAATSLGGDARVLALTVATWIAYFAFLLYLRRYFVMAAT